MGYQWYHIYHEYTRTYQGIQVSFLDVGQGDAIFIETPRGYQILVDGGRGVSVLRALRSIMPKGDVTIDMVVATHADADHIGGLLGVFDTYEVAHMVSASPAGDTRLYKDLQEKIKKEKSITTDIVNPLHLKVDGTDIFFLWPLSTHINETNASSIVMKIVDRKATALITGDAPLEVENYLVALYKKALTSDILKAGHHGSKTSTGELFLKTVSPKEVVVSAGKNNTYGHPHKEVLDRISAQESIVRTTAEHGTVRYVSNGKSFVFSK
ncbi:MAG: ComEC/Rec2 family competence protein [Alphaproteobacteria bacterium]|nr:ComEC/Rec2 family competence protein [Alphaproteobacteria bacterium]